jgi:uncharacterized protein YhfF
MPRSIPPQVLSFWQAFAASREDDVESRFYEVCVFDDNESSANALAGLVLRGAKRATAGLVWSFEAAGMPMPNPGDLSIVANWAGEPLCVIETECVDIVPFCEVTAEFAAVEGEGDGSLQYWQRAHASYFSRECGRIGREPSPGMPVACERFRVVYAPSNADADRLGSS